MASTKAVNPAEFVTTCRQAQQLRNTIARLCLVAAAAAVFANGAIVRAGILFDNLGAATFSSDPVSGPAAPLSDSFSTGNLSAALTDVQVLLDGSNLHDGFTQVDLFSDAGIAPGNLLLSIGTVPDSALTATPSVFDFPVVVPYVLAANSRFWI